MKGKLVVLGGCPGRGQARSRTCSAGQDWVRLSPGPHRPALVRTLDAAQPKALPNDEAVLT